MKIKMKFFCLLVLLVSVFSVKASHILLPMEVDVQKNHLKAYGITYWALDKSYKVSWLLNYRGGSFLLPDAPEIRKECQINISKKVDHRYWEAGSIIDWIDLINCIKSVDGVKRVLDNYFFPNNDLIIPIGMLPRVRGFMLLDLQGQIISNSSNTLNPIYYPNEIDFNYPIYSWTTTKEHADVLLPFPDIIMWLFKREFYN
jgi:hypothetical protein